MADITGRCLCGAIRYRADAPPLWTTMCHCDSCRRACSAPIVAWMGFATESVSWTGKRAFYASSPQATRGFCPTCGTQMSFESTHWPGEIHLFAVSSDQPERYTPQSHCHFAERLEWLGINDDLPKWPATAETGTNQPMQKAD